MHFFQKKHTALVCMKRKYHSDTATVHFCSFFIIFECSQYSEDTKLTQSPVYRYALLLQLGNTGNPPLNKWHHKNSKYMWDLIKEKKSTKWVERTESQKKTPTHSEWQSKRMQRVRSLLNPQGHSPRALQTCSELNAPSAPCRELTTIRHEACKT